jgi:uncharacterized membrane protein YjjP (DUF1212 family)
MTLTAVERLNRGLGLDAVVVPSWSALTLTAAGSRNTVLTAAVSPTAINMHRVGTMMSVVDSAQDGPLELERVVAGVADAEAQSGSGTAAFVVACATGAAGLAVIYGATHPLVILLVALAAAGGGLLRRWLGAIGAGPLVQVFVAATLAGALGAAPAHLHLGASTAVVAICPAMVMVPGPHILNGALDLLDLRVTLGIARLAFGLLILTAIACGIILGLQAGGQTLPVTAPSSSAPLVVDVLAAGVAAASYPVYFSMRWQLIGWPVAVGMLAHAVHWYALEAGDQSGAGGVRGLSIGRRGTGAGCPLEANPVRGHRVRIRRRTGTWRIRVPDAGRVRGLRRPSERAAPERRCRRHDRRDDRRVRDGARPGRPHARLRNPSGPPRRP